MNGNSCPPSYGAYGGVAETTAAYASSYGVVGLSEARYSGVYTTVDQTATSTVSFGGSGSSVSVGAGDAGGGSTASSNFIGGECSVVSVSQSAPLPGYTSVIVDAQQYQLGIGADFTVH